MHEFRLEVSHSQLSVFNSDLKNPFNDWSDRGFSQGFAWRDVSVSFRTPFESGLCSVLLFLNEPSSLSADAIRAFRVPFRVTKGPIEVASIPDSIAIEIPAGEYSLQVEFLTHSKESELQAIVRLNRGMSGFAILVADDDIDCNGDLDLEGKSAI